MQILHTHFGQAEVAAIGNGRSLVSSRRHIALDDTLRVYVEESSSSGAVLDITLHGDIKAHCIYYRNGYG